VIHDLLRGELGFHGLVTTDDLDMGAILEPYGQGASGLEQVIHLAITAGNDIAMICHRVEMCGTRARFLAGVPRAELDRALENVANFKGSLVPPDAWSEEGIPPPRRGSMGAARSDARRRSRRRTQLRRRQRSPVKCITFVSENSASPLDAYAES